MIYIRQFGIILGVTFLGELLNSMIPLPIPASIYGLLIMLTLLSAKAIRLNQVKEAGSFLIEFMPLMFIPAAAGILTSWNVLKPILIPLIIITVLTTIFVMAVTGKVTQYVLKNSLKAQKRKDTNCNEDSIM